MLAIYGTPSSSIALFKHRICCLFMRLVCPCHPFAQDGIEGIPSSLKGQSQTPKVYCEK